MEKQTSIQAFDWKAGLILFLGLLAGQTAVAIIAVICESIFNINYTASPLFNMAAYALSMIGPIFFYEVFILKPIGKRLQFNFRSMPVSVYLIIFPMMFGMMLISEFFVSLIPTTGPVFGEIYQSFENQMSMMATDNVSMIITVVIFAPILEEIVFRGILQKSLVKKGLKPSHAILISSFIFGAVHGYPWQFVGAFLLGTVLGLVYQKTKSLLMPILLHAFNNLISALMVIFLGEENLESLFNWSHGLSLLLGLVLFGGGFYMLVCRKAIIFDE